MTSRLAVPLLAASLALTGCSNLSDMETRMLTGGALTGGLGTGAGAAIGGAVGRAVGYVVHKVAEN